MFGEVQAEAAGSELRGNEQKANVDRIWLQLFNLYDIASNLRVRDLQVAVIGTIFYFSRCQRTGLPVMEIHEILLEKLAK